MREMLFVGLTVKALWFAPQNCIIKTQAENIFEARLYLHSCLNRNMAAHPNLEPGLETHYIIIILLSLCYGLVQLVKNLPAMQEIQVQSLSGEDPLEKEMTTPCSILPWEIPWTEEPGGVQSLGLQRVTHDLATTPPPYYTNIIYHYSVLAQAVC